MVSGNKLDKALVLGAWLISFIICMFFLPYLKGINGTIDEGGDCQLVLPTNWWEVNIIHFLIQARQLTFNIIITNYLIQAYTINTPSLPLNMIH